MSGTAAFAAIALQLAGLLGRPLPPAQVPAFHERVLVTAPRPDAELFRSMTSGGIGRDELIALGGDLTRGIEVAADVAGAFVGSRQVRMDGLNGGLPASGTPADSIAIHADPFSVEYGGLDQLDVVIDMLPPSRRWTFNVTPPALRAGGADPLAGHPPRTRRLGAFVAGPVPGTPFTFFTRGDSFEQREAPAFAAPDGGLLADASNGITETRSASAAFGLTWVGRAALVRGTMLNATTDITNAGIGGLSSPEAAFSLASRSMHAQITWRVSGRLQHRGGAAVRRSRVETAARLSAPASISPSLLMSGSELRHAGTDAAGWTIRHVTQPPHQRWLAGVELSRDAIDEARLYGEGGVRRHAADGSSSLTEVTALRDAGATATSAAAFAHGIVRLGSAAGLRAGLRADWLASEGAFLSPRVSLGARIAGTALSASAALSAEQWTASHLVALEWRGASVAAWQIDGRPLGLRIDPGFRRRRNLITRVGAARQIGRVTAGIEQTWTRGAHLAGSTRAADGDGLVDTLASDRRLARSQTHVTARATAGPLSLVSHYEWVRAYDDSDGWLALPARQDAPGAEWGRSTGMARHHASFVVAGRLAASMQLVAVVRAASGTPYGVLSGLDPERLGTFTDRAGRPRNSHETPGWTNVSVYLSRSFRLPGLAAAGIDVGVRVENVLDAARIGEAGRVLSTPLFGRALAAGAGRALGVWMMLARR